jgi:hypothetical protein
MGFSTSTDSHSVNKLLIKHFETQLGENDFFLAFLCVQHRTGSIVEVLAEIDKLLPHLFCLASVLQGCDFLDESSDERLGLFVNTIEIVVVEMVEEDAQIAMSLLEMCFVCSDTSNITGQCRRAKAHEFVLFFPWPWNGVLRHCCKGTGCCRNLEHSKARARHLISTVVLQAIGIPAANKWTKVFPTAARVALGRCFYNILAVFLGGRSDSVMFEQARTVGLVNDNADSDVSEAAHIGAPRNERKNAGKRKARALKFLLDEDSDWILLLWIVISRHVMRIHFRLYNYGTWYTHCTDDRIQVFDWVNPSTNPARACISRLSMMLYDSNGAGAQYLLPLFGILGENIPEWPARVLLLARKMLITCICQLWRTLVLIWNVYPWLLAFALDPSYTEDQRREAWTRFLEASDCCLDAGLGKQLRAYLSKLESSQLADLPNLETFLRTLFERGVVTSTFVERIFGKFTQWTKKKGFN